MPRQYNLRNRNSPKELDKDDKSSPQIKKRSPRSPNMSGYSSSDSYRDNQGSDDLDHLSDSQEEDETDFSYASTTFSLTASTPSPGQYPHHRVLKESRYETPPSGKKLYPDLLNLSDETLSPEKERAVHTPKQPRMKTTPVKSDKNKSGTDFTMYIIAAVVFIFVMVIILPGSKRKPGARTSEFQAFVTKVDELQVKFKSQEKRTWRNIKSSVKHILNSTDPEYPAVVMFAVKKDIDTVGSCLARRVASLFSSITADSKEDGYLDARLLSHLEPPKQKEDLDERIHSNLKTGRSVVIDHLEALSPTASLLLHGICDNDNAPFKNVFIGIVFYVDKSLKVPDVDTELTNYFSKELDMDKIGALLTRINNNAVVISKEADFDVSVCEETENLDF